MERIYCCAQKNLHLLIDFRIYKGGAQRRWDTHFIVATCPWPGGKGKPSLSYLVQRWEFVSRVLQSDSQMHYEIVNCHDKCTGDLQSYITCLTTFKYLYKLAAWIVFIDVLKKLSSTS